MTPGSAPIAFSVAVTGYFVLWNLAQLAMGPAAAAYLWRHRRRNTVRALALVEQHVLPPQVSIIVPAYNEQLTIVDSVRALMALEYASAEIVVVNDGSSDGTLALLRETFHLVEAPLAFVQPLACKPIRSIYRSIDEPGLVVVDKANGGCKSDAVNAGISAASSALVLVIDADTVLERDALNRAVLPFLEDPATVAVGANVAIANGCRIEHGRIVEVALPRNWLARFQIVEYIRAFMLFRLACAAAGGVVLISGAFGLFRRDALIAIGGYDTTAIGEDMDVTIRLQRHYRARGLPIRIGFDPNALGWTQAPEDARSLASQRKRWRRGLLQVLWRHRGMIGNARYSAAGLAALPFIAVFEALGAPIEIGGYVITCGAAVAGLLDWTYFFALLAASILLGTAVTLLSVLLSDVATRRYMQRFDLVLLVLVALAENFGYRQLNSWWGCVGTLQALTGKGGWGQMRRHAFDSRG